MALQHLLQLLIIVIAIFCVLCDHKMDDINKMMQERQQKEIKKYCGKHLTDALAALCQGNYQTLRPVRIRKKNYWESQYFGEMAADQPSYDSSQRREATAMLENFGKKRRRRGVYNECCEKPCTREQLSMYCAAPSKR